MRLRKPNLIYKFFEKLVRLVGKPDVLRVYIWFNIEIVSGNNQEPNEVLEMEHESATFKASTLPSR